jgi:hypothetical protein
MKAKQSAICALALAMFTAPGAAIGQPYPLGTAFTYQARLLDGGVPAEGDYDFEFTLYDDPTGGSVVAGPITKDDWAVAYGLFTAPLDFGSDVFTGDARWLRIGVRPWDSTGAYTYLAPRQELTPAPYAQALPGLWTQQNASSPNLIGGYNGNSVTTGVMGAAIGGGGASASANQVTDDFGTIGGGVGNQAGNNDGDVANAAYATVGGGQYHEASGQQSAVGGGWFNQATGPLTTIAGGGGNIASARAATVGGGWLNEVAAEYGTIAGGGASDPGDDATRNRVFDDYGTIGGGGKNRAGSDDGNPATAPYATVAGGRNNQATRTHSTVSGGQDNTASADYATVGGGISNIASTARWTTVGGGVANTANDEGATVGGGHQNLASGIKSVVAGGYLNTASASVSTVGGGTTNSAGEPHATVAGGGGNVANGWAAAVGGGEVNTASGSTATVPGGYMNTAAGSYSLAAGRRAKANHGGTFVWADSTDADFTSTGVNQFLIRAGGGVGIGTVSPTEALTVLGNVDFSGNVIAGGDIQVSANVVNTGMPISIEQSTSSTSFVQLTAFDIPDQNTDRLVTMNVRFHARGQAPGQTAVFLVRGFSYGDGYTSDLADHYGSAPRLGVIHVRNSSYADYRLNLGPFALTDNQRWRFIVFYRTRNGSYPAYIDELEWEARSLRYEY